MYELPLTIGCVSWITLGRRDILCCISALYCVILLQAKLTTTGICDKESSILSNLRSSSTELHRGNIHVSISWCYAPGGGGSPRMQ